MAQGKPVYESGTTVAVVERDKDTGVPSSHIEIDANGNRWHIQEGKDPVLLRDVDEYNAVVGGK